MLFFPLTDDTMIQGLHPRKMPVVVSLSELQSKNKQSGTKKAGRPVNVTCVGKEDVTLQERSATPRRCSLLFPFFSCTR